MTASTTSAPLSVWTGTRPRWFGWAVKTAAAVSALAATAAAGRVLVAVAVEQVVDGSFSIAPPVILTGAFLLGALAAGGTHYVVAVRLARWIERRLSAVRLRTLRALHRLSPGEVRGNRRSMRERLSAEVDGLSCYARWDGRALPAGLAQLGLSAAVMTAYSARVTFMVLAGSLSLAFLVRRAERRLVRARAAASARDDELARISRGVLLMAAFNRATDARRRAEQEVDTAMSSRDEAALRAVRASAALTGLRELSVGTVIGFAVVGALTAGLPAGQTVALALLAATAAQPVLSLAGVVAEAHRAADRVAQLKRPLVMPRVDDPGVNGRALPDGPFDVRFESVSSAGADGSGLRAVSLTIPAGRVVALLGPPGSGHPVVADLVTRIADPTDGRVLMGGVPLTDVRFDSLRRRVLALPRNGFIVSGTVADNIRLGLPDASDDDVYRACSDLGLDKWLSGLEGGLRARVGRDGHRLSTAERYLVALARAYVNRPDVLVVSDGYGGDPAMQERIDQALTVACRGRTTILITHRPNSAKIADEVMVFDGGRLVERGTYATLSQDPDTAYARLHLSRALAAQP